MLVSNAPSYQFLGYVAAHNRTPKLCLLLFSFLFFFHGHNAFSNDCVNLGEMSAQYHLRLFKETKC